MSVESNDIWEVYQLETMTIEEKKGNYDGWQQ